MENYSEGKIQQSMVVWFRNNYCLKFHNPRCCIFSVPNERSNKKEQMRMIATGLYAGVSDLIVLIPDKILFIEVKDSKGKQQPKQKDFESTVNQLGFEYHLVRTLDEFQYIIKLNIK